MTTADVVTFLVTSLAVGLALGVFYTVSKGPRA